MMKRRLIVFVTALVAMLTFALPSGHAAAATDNTVSTSQQVAFTTPIVLTNDNLTKDVCGNLAYDSTGLAPHMAPQEIDKYARASSALLPINRWSEATSNFYTNLDEGLFSLNTKRMNRETITGTMFSISSTIWEGTTATSIWATAFCPIDKMAGPIDMIIGDIGNFLINGEGTPLLVMIVTALVATALWNSRRGTGWSFAWGQVITKAVIIAVLVLMVAGATNATNSPNGRGTGLAPGNIVAKTNEVVTNLGTLATAGVTDLIAEQGYAKPNGSGKSNLSCQHAIHSLNESYRTAHINTSGAGDLSATIPMMLSNSWVDTGYMTWLRAQFGPMSDDTNSPQNYVGCYALDWTSGLPQITSNPDDLESRADLYNAGFRGGYNNGEFAKDSDMLSSGIRLHGGKRKDAHVNNIITPESPEQHHQAIMFLSMCDVVGEGDPSNESFWEIRPMFSESDLTANDCADAWTISEQTESGNSGDAECEPEARPQPDGSTLYYDCNGNMITQGQYDNLRDGESGGTAEEQRATSALGKFKMPDTSQEVHEMFGQGTPAADYVNYVNGHHSMSAIGSGAVMIISSIILFTVFGLISLLVVIVRTAMVVVGIYLFAMALKGLFSRDAVSPLVKAAKLLIGVVMLSVFTQLLYSIVVGVSSLLNAVGHTFMASGSIPYLLWVAITPGLALLLIHMIFKWAKLPSPLTLNGAKAWGKGLALDGGQAAINATGGNSGNSLDPRKSRTGQAMMSRLRSGSRAADREGSIESTMLGERDQLQTTGAGATDGHAEESAAQSIAGQGEQSEGVENTEGVGGSGQHGAPGETSESAAAGMAPTRDDKRKVAALRAAERRDANAQRRKDRWATLRSPSKLGEAIWQRSKNGMAAMKARGVKGNLRKAATTAAKAGALGIGGLALASTGGLPALALGFAGVKGAKAIKNALADRGLVGRGNRDTFARDVQAYVSAGRPEVEVEKSRLGQAAEDATQWASQTAAGQWASGKAEAFTEQIKEAGGGAKSAAQMYWTQARGSAGRAAQGAKGAAESLADTFRPAYEQRGASDEDKDIAYANLHGLDPSNPEQLAQARQQREAAVAEKQQAAEQKKAEQDAKKQQREQAAEQARRKRGAARAAMRQQQQGGRKVAPVKPDTPRETGPVPSNGQKPGTAPVQPTPDVGGSNNQQRG